MYLLGQDGETESDALKKGRYIKQVHISGHEGEILTDIADDNLYLRHLPETYQSGRHINAVRFVMILHIRKVSKEMPEKYLYACDIEYGYKRQYSSWQMISRRAIMEAYEEALEKIRPWLEKKKPLFWWEYLRPRFVKEYIKKMLRR